MFTPISSSVCTRIPTLADGLFLTARHDRGADLLVSRDRELSLVRRVSALSWPNGRACGHTEGNPRHRS